MDFDLNYIDYRRRGVWTSSSTAQKRTSRSVAVGVDFIAVVGDIIYFVWDWAGRYPHVGVVAVGAERGRVYDWCFGGVLVAGDR